MSTTDYRNQEALNKALNIYRTYMRAFIIFHLKKVQGQQVEDVIIDSLDNVGQSDRADEIDRLLCQSNRDIKSIIDIDDFPRLVNANWNSFKTPLNDDKTFRNQLWLIKDGRDQSWAHPPEGDAESEGTRAYLFLIADVLRKINRPDKLSEVEAIRDELFYYDSAERLEKSEKRLKDLESDAAFSALTSSHCIEHFVFCHLVPGLDEFFRQCAHAFASEKPAYLHLIYNSEQDIEGLAQKYPDREALEKLYPELRKLAGANGNFITTGGLYSILDMAKLGIETGLAIFEELQLLERNDEGIKLLPPAGKKLDSSEIYRRGEQLKSGAADFQAFQFEQSIEHIGEALLKELNVDNENILEASSVYEVRAFQDAIEDSNAQSEPSTDAVENDSKSDAEVSEARSEPPTDVVEDDNIVDNEYAATKRRSSIAERYVKETTEEERNALAVQIAEMRINAAGSRPIAWKDIREQFGLKNDQFHKVIRESKGYRDAVIARIKTLKAQDGGWEYNGKLGSLTGIDNIEDFLK